jgi:short-subunit dehydrogenase
MSGAPRAEDAIVITGSSTGIGHAAALLLDRSGYRVFAGVRKQHDLERLRREGSERLCPLLLDITNQQQIDAAAKVVAAKLGPERGLRGLINNAGICEPGPIEFICLDRVRFQIETNVIGQLAVLQAFMPLIRKGHGRIVNVGSAASEISLPLMGAYAASKRAFDAMNDALRRELRTWGIPVSLVIPGNVETPIWDKTTLSSPRLPDSQLDDKDGLYQKMRESMIALMTQGRRVAIQPEALAAVIKQALEARRPNARYRRGPGSRMAYIWSNVPAFLGDWVLDSVLNGRLPAKLGGW